MILPHELVRGDADAFGKKFPFGEVTGIDLSRLGAYAPIGVDGVAADLVLRKHIL